MSYGVMVKNSIELTYPISINGGGLRYFFILNNQKTHGKLIK